MVGDFMSKPFVGEILLSKIKVFLDLYHQRTKLEELVGQLNAKNEALEIEISQRKRAEAALQKANNDKDRLFSIISHDLRDPFQILLGYAKWMAERTETLSRADIQEMAASIADSEGTIGRLMNDQALYNNMNTTLSELLKLVYDFREEPERFLTINFRLF